MTAAFNFAGRDLYQYYGLMDRLKSAGKQIFERNGSRLGDFFNSLVTFIDRRDKEAPAYNCVPWGINYLIRKSECARDTFYRYFNVLIDLGIVETQRGPGFKDPVVVYLPFVDKELNVNASVFDNLTEERINEIIAKRNGEVVQPEVVVDNSSPVVQLADIHTTDTKSLKDLNNIITISSKQNFLDELKNYATNTATSRQNVNVDTEEGVTCDRNAHGGASLPDVKLFSRCSSEPMQKGGLSGGGEEQPKDVADTSVSFECDDPSASTVAAETYSRRSGNALCRASSELAEPLHTYNSVPLQEGGLSGGDKIKRMYSEMVDTRVCCSSTEHGDTNTASGGYADCLTEVDESGQEQLARCQRLVSEEHTLFSNIIGRIRRNYEAISMVKSKSRQG